MSRLAEKHPPHVAPAPLPDRHPRQRDHDAQVGGPFPRPAGVAVGEAAVALDAAPGDLVAVPRARLIPRCSLRPRTFGSIANCETSEARYDSSKSSPQL